MILLASLLTASIHAQLDLTPLLRRRHAQTEAGVTCGIATVGYRFTGTAGQTFRYAGDTYTIPEEGVVELIADSRSTTFSFEGRERPLDLWPRNQFGFREVSLLLEPGVERGR